MEERRANHCWALEAFLSKFLDFHAFRIKKVILSRFTPATLHYEITQVFRESEVQLRKLLTLVM